MVRCHTALVVAITAFFALGCGEQVDGSDGYVYDGPVNACTNGKDCPTGTCHPDLKLCVVSPPTDRSYYVKVIPESEIAVPSQVFTVALNASGAVTTPLELAAPVVVQGMTVAQTAAQGIEALEARVIFADVGNQLPGRPARLTVYESTGDSTYFDLDLLPSIYNMIVIPEDRQADDHAVTYMHDIVLDKQGFLRDASGQKIDLVLPLAEIEVRGVIRQGGLQMNGLAVVAIDPQTLRIVSTEATTHCTEILDDTCGWFAIRLAPGVETFSLKISRPAEPHHPLVIVPGFNVPEGDEIIDLTDDASLSLDPLGVPVRYHASVERPVELSTGTIMHDPAPGCFVLFESDSVAGGSVSRWVSTNESGAIEESEGELGVNLYPGQYRVTAIPAEASSNSTTDYTAFISPEPISIAGAPVISGQVFPLPFRPLYKGRVLAQGEEVPQAILVAQPHLDEADFPRSSTASTELDGRFSLWLDPGTYRVVAEAPPESGYAWGTTVAEVNGNGWVELNLPLPFAASAVLESVDANVTVGGALVEWYYDFDDTDGRAYAVARVAADAEGRVIALLPR